ncbi:MAG: ferritin-like domain-containing protein [Myxococcales bacterium FL481]|nr:MAG: ferritin-like domain-containing protein [Myxococcales bacterium FL481]
MTGDTAGEVLDLGELGLDRGGHLLVARKLRELGPGARLRVHGRAPALAVHLQAWARAQGHGFSPSTARDRHASPWAGSLTMGDAVGGRWRGAERAGHVDPRADGGVAEVPPDTWGLAARGATVEAGGPRFGFSLGDKVEVWTDEAARLYAQAAAAQWDPDTAVDWDATFELPPEVEDAVVQVMTYLIENETAALIVPARFLAQIHPHFREVMQVLAIQVADEARHLEVFTRRARLKRDALGLSTVGGQASLKTLLDEPDFALASFLLSVLGEGSFLSLLWFLEEHAPDPITRAVAKLSAQDEARHVAFGLAHLSRHGQQDPGLHDRLADAVLRRHDALLNTAGLNEEVFDALILLAAGSWQPEAIAAGYDRVVALKQHMDHGRRTRLKRLGFTEARAEELSRLHTRNFM